MKYSGIKNENGNSAGCLFLPFKGIDDLQYIKLKEFVKWSKRIGPNLCIKVKGSSQKVMGGIGYIELKGGSRRAL
jgi:hypothetical protein